MGALDCSGGDWLCAVRPAAPAHALTSVRAPRRCNGQVNEPASTRIGMEEPVARLRRKRC